MRKTALAIAGSDCSGGAGIQADIKTMLANGVYAMSAVTALTAQNTLGVAAVMEVPAEFLRQQLDAVFTDIPPDAVKIGMAVSGERIRVIADALRRYHAPRIVIDPVMVSTSGCRLLDEGAVRTLEEELLPLATLITPNIPEAEVLWGNPIVSAEDMEEAAEGIGRRYGAAVLCKGGHRKGDADDLLYSGGRRQWFRGKRVENPNTHGTGCTLSSAIASYLARGFSLEEAVKQGKEYISHILETDLDLGGGRGPLDHGFLLN